MGQLAIECTNLHQGSCKNCPTWTAKQGDGVDVFHPYTACTIWFALVGIDASQVLTHNEEILLCT